MKVWLDDVRPKPEQYDVWAKTADEAIYFLQSGTVTEASLDHDLGEDKTGYDVAVWIEQAAFENTIPRFKWKVHSANPVGAAKMEEALKNADAFWSKNEV